VDPLALLCNLFAEGPSTLRVLHRAGIRTLANVLATSDWALAELLGGSPSSARRFLREAARLARGSPGPLLDAEDAEDAFRFA
jgi:hypothetical protein